MSITTWPVLRSLLTSVDTARCEDKVATPVTARAVCAVKVPADVIAPVPVVLIELLVVIEFAVAIVPNPLAIEPEDRAPVPSKSPVLPVVMTVPALPVSVCGKVMATSADGLPKARVVSKPSVVDHSKTSAF